MKTLLSILHLIQRALPAGLFFIPVILMAEGNWPKEIKTDKLTVIIYQPQPDSMIGDHFYARAAVSVTTPEIATPIFGAVWADSKISADRETGLCSIYNVKVMNMRFPSIDTVDPVKVQNFKKMLEDEATTWNLEFSLDELKSSLALNAAAVSKSADFNNNPPNIIFVDQKSVLVLYDSDPIFKDVENHALKRAINTPYLVLQDIKDNNCYLYGAGYWYKSTDPVKAEWTSIPKPPSDVARFYNEMKKENKKTGDNAGQTENKQPADKNAVIPKIIIATTPTELIQSLGEPKYATIQGTGLLYVTNTEDNIFMTLDPNQYYILLSGRWFHSAALTGPWSYIRSDRLPPDFAKIPEGSEKDMVLASVAGTDAAREAVMDAQIPQTTAVNRQTAKCEVKYNGDPKFEAIKGTDILRGMNTASTVLLYHDVYYVCDNAVWFTGKSPEGPWEVATSIPGEFQKIPPDDPSYNVKYVYIYDVEPDLVYVGYTPGYTCCYVYGPTVVYGTGWIYPSFYGPCYYPRPVTYGFGMYYNPWYGWSFGFYVSVGWFPYAAFGPVFYPAGWWGPPLYHPPYYPPYNHYYGPRTPVCHGGHNNIYIDNHRNANIYNRRADGSTKTVMHQPYASNVPVTGNKNAGKPSGATGRSKPNTVPGSGNAITQQRPVGQKNNVFTDQKGNIFRNDNGYWQKNDGKSWEPVQPKTPVQNSGFSRQEMDMQNQIRERGSQNTINRSALERSMLRQSGARMGGVQGRRR